MALNSLYCADVPLSNYSLTHPCQRNLYLGMPLPIALAPDPVHLVSCTQHTSIFLLCNVSTTSANLPDIVPKFQVADLMQSRTLEVFFHPPPPSLQGIRSMTFIMTGTPSCSLAGFPIVLFLVGRWGCPRGTKGCTLPIFVVIHVE